MLSVCVPNYSFLVLPQAHSPRNRGVEGPAGQVVCGQLHLLYDQLKASGLNFEVLVYEDASPEHFFQHNQQVANLGKEVRYKLLPSNVGRASIRNLLATEARFPNLLFLDSDSGFPEQFVSRYLPFLEQPLEFIVSGGRVYPQRDKIDRAYWLHQRYGQKREQLDPTVRGEKRYHGFQTNNFLVSKALMLRHPFNESHAGYGHEDTLWGWQLKELGIDIRRIDNPVIHLDLMPAEQFLSKQLEAVENLKKLEEDFPNLPTRLSSFGKRWAWAKPLLMPVLTLLKPIAERKLVNDASGSLYWLDALKLYRYWKQSD
ncbi:MAG: glycosyltransferase [Bacteroidota bacterium]